MATLLKNMSKDMGFFFINMENNIFTYEHKLMLM